MADNYLITGYWGEPHVTAENDRGINAAMFGTGRFVLPVGEQFKAEYIGNNTVRMYDGKLMDNGAAAGIPVGEYVDFLISNAGQGMKRNDLIVFQYEQDGSTLVEKGTFVVIQGEETSGTASDPELTQEDLLSGTATFDQMAMWRVSVSGATIAAPVKVFSLYDHFDSIVAPGGTMTGKLSFNNNLGINALLSDGTTAGMIGRNEHNNLWLGSATNEAQGDVFLATSSVGNAFVSRNNIRTKILDYGIVGKTLWTGSWAVGEAKMIAEVENYSLFLTAAGANSTPILIYRNGNVLRGGGFFPSGAKNWILTVAFTISGNTLTYLRSGTHTVSLSSGAIGDLASDDLTLVKLIGIV